MCNCKELPTSVAEIEHWGHGFHFPNALTHNRHFETLDSEYFEPQLDYSEFMYRCTECGQAWYIECTPEASPSSLFALKVRDTESLPSDKEVKSAKEHLCILAHGGFDSEKCRMAGCQNDKLLGRELCYLHLSFP
ncbi:hypothetical protein ECA3131 [Pectobacterium atrosepticum SCRI1043]|uniref:Uncharacterized protein n=1 Tax=Pectobacterium atrosepticum (strain SCRI 1043 / ATCC BAA-672) TaxID=218491 RepID=Q6D2G4_PECAS|nr:hypothetical protein CVS35_15465 [Pectobacterium atrosepticum]CAG76030.1 hypothetical protein ECA3131 [Pectobacterium atrosepticum SCRI1043]MCL6314896.1 hypothetical protein [Pectobacterium atrosepticum]MCL6320868.1 hypothetical protein [Pectobacterium atrosepticum]MCL6391378.1 hypothetical protein [Pectobacterium atrosepticum]